MEINFRKNLRKILDDRDISVKELASMTGISKRTLENYLGSRESIPPVDYGYRIAKVLDVTVEYLLTGTDKNTMRDESGKAVAFKNFFKKFNSSESMNNLSEEDMKAVSDIVNIIINVKNTTNHVSVDNVEIEKH